MLMKISSKHAHISRSNTIIVVFLSSGRPLFVDHFLCQVLPTFGDFKAIQDGDSIEMLEYFLCDRQWQKDDKVGKIFCWLC